ncbi:glycoprotein [Amblyomma dissimile mivirus]|nr:glycoprotein [Amblyomma dissimile mivirus]
MGVFCTVLLCFFLPLCQGLIGYDCTGKLSNITAISVFSVTPCNAPTVTIEEKVDHIQIIQARGTARVHTRSCLVERTYMIFHCGMHHHSSFGNFAFGEIIHLSKESCLVAHHHGTMRLSATASLDNLHVNATTSRSVFLHGGTDNGFYCEGETFTFKDVRYKSAVLQASYTITLSEEWASIDLDTAMLRSSSGFSHPFKVGKAFDATTGDTFWETTDLTACTPTAYHVLYEGSAVFFTNAAKTQTMVVNTSQHAMAVEIVKPTIICHQHALQTEHPKIFIIVRQPGHAGFYFQKSSLDVADVDMLLYINSKLVYVERHIGSEISRVYQNFHKRLCDTQLQLMRHMTTLAITSPEEFAWVYAQRPGVTGVLRGELVYVMECAPVPVTIRKPTKCYQELPVRYNETDVFLKPRSRIIVSFGTEVECSPLVPSGFLLEGSWWALTPSATVLSTPITLSAEPGTPAWEYRSPPGLFTSGIYSVPELLAYQKRLIFAIERPAITHTVSAAVAKAPADLSGLDGASLFHPGQLEKLQQSFMAKVWGWYWNASVALGGIAGIYFICGTIKAVFNAAFHCGCLYKAYGCSLEICACCFSSLAKYLLMEKRIDPGRRTIRQGLEGMLGRPRQREQTSAAATRDVEGNRPDEETRGSEEVELLVRSPPTAPPPSNQVATTEPITRPPSSDHSFPTSSLFGHLRSQLPT